MVSAGSANYQYNYIRKQQTLRKKTSNFIIWLMPLLLLAERSNVEASEEKETMSTISYLESVDEAKLIDAFRAVIKYEA